MTTQTPSQLANVTAPPRKTQRLVIRPTSGWAPLRLGELWDYRELLVILTARDIRIRYKQTALGAMWAVVQPVFSMIVFSIFFGKLAKMPSDGIPYPIFAFCGLLPWQLFAKGLTDATFSITVNRQLITKVYFPRLILPLSSILSGLVDFAISLGVFSIMLVKYGITPTASVLFVPVLVVFALITALAVGLWLSALNIRYRDVQHTIPFLTQIWMFATPIAYPASLVPVKWRAWYGLNPMTGVVEGFRWALVGQGEPVGPEVFVSMGAVFVLLIGGLYYFRRTESAFADLALSLSI